MNMPFIVKFLEHGEENAKSQERLQIETGLSRRELRAAVFDARSKGVAILSNTDRDNGGYYLPASNDELRRYVAFQKSRINSAREAMRAAEQLLRSGGIKDEHI